MDNKIKIDFNYIDEHGQKSRLIKTFNECVLDDTDSFDLLLSEFKNFIRSAGFAESYVNKINFND